MNSSLRDDSGPDPAALMAVTSIGVDHDQRLLHLIVKVTDGLQPIYDALWENRAGVRDVIRDPHPGWNPVPAPPARLMFSCLFTYACIDVLTHAVFFTAPVVDRLAKFAQLDHARVALSDSRRPAAQTIEALERVSLVFDSPQRQLYDALSKI